MLGCSDQSQKSQRARKCSASEKQDIKGGTGERPSTEV